jgi:hypothetical protein
MATAHLKFAKTGRHGLSLLEVILALTILGGSFVVVGELVRIGIISGLETRLRSEANILADAILAEFSAGVLELQSRGPTAIEGSPDWYYSADVQPSEQLGLLLVTVTVGRSKEKGEDSLSIKLARFLPDPDYDPAAEEGGSTE